MDVNPEERARGKTQELSLCSFVVAAGGGSPVKINVLDAPGHRNYVGEMIDGSSRADVGILVVSARSGEFEAGFRGGQTREHLRLLRASSSVGKLVVLVNKMDEVGWESGRLAEITRKLSKFIGGLFGEYTVIPVSGMGGDNLVKRREGSERTLLEELTEYGSVSGNTNKGSNSNKGSNNNKGSNDNNNNSNYGNSNYTNQLNALVVERSRTSCAIKIEAGVLRTNEEYSLVSQGGTQVVVVSEVRDEEDEEADGSLLRGVYRIRLSRAVEAAVGSRIVDGALAERVVSRNRIVAVIGVYGDCSKCVTVGYSGVMHMNGVSVGVKVTGIWDTGKRKRRVAPVGEKSIVRIEIKDGIVVDRRKRERFSLRDEDATVGIGEIIG
ncbi:ERF3 [Enterospora canceri]|uniref:ERF3 n=1 Tax=Enterospora canceri TaxID=1081671 RepID=A0A1Y1S431_9MICR|nr:ERF3 [Enterospora canceri]